MLTGWAMNSLSGRIWGFLTGRGPGDVRRRWYHEGEAPSLAIHHQRAKDAHAGPIAEARTYLALYYNRPMMTLDPAEGGKVIGFDGLADQGFNVMHEAVRGGKSQIVQPMQARVTPVGGTWETQQACEKLGQVIDGIMDLCNFTDLVGQLVVDGILCGEGFGLVELDPITKNFTDVRLDPLETFLNYDRTEAVTLRAFTRRKAMLWFPEWKEQIWNAPRYTPEHVTEVDYAGEWDADDLVGIYQGWTDPMGNEAGKYCAQLWGTATVLTKSGAAEKWERPKPVFGFRWDHGHREASNKPGGRTAAPMHYWINEIVRNSYETLAGNIPYVEGNVDPQWNDVPYKFIPAGTEARVHMPNLSGLSLNKEMREDLRMQVMREFGLSEEAIHGSAPPQFKSGVALSNWVQIQNKGLSQQHRGVERCHTEAARIKVSWFPEVYASGKAVAKAMGSEILEQIDYKEASLPEDSYKVGFEVVSALPKSIPQKIETLAFMEEKGLLDGEDILTHINEPDFRAARKRKLGPRDLMNRQIDAAKKHGDLIPPSEVQDCAKLAELVGQELQAAEAQHVKPPRKNLQALLHLYLLAKERAGMKDPALAAPGVVPGGPAGGVVAPAGPVPGAGVGPITPAAPGIPAPMEGALPEVPLPTLPNEPLPTS